MPTIQELQQMYKKLAKRLDQRLREMERAGQTRYAYQVAQREYKHLFGNERKEPRFERRLPDNVQQLRAGINAVETVLNLPSSTKRGMRAITAQAAATLNKNYKGIDIGAADLGSFFESGIYKDLRTKYSSDTIVRGIAKMRQDEERIERQLDRFGKYHVHGNYQNDPVRKFIEDQVNKEGFELNELFEGLGY